MYLLNNGTIWGHFTLSTLLGTCCHRAVCFFTQRDKHATLSILHRRHGKGEAKTTRPPPPHRYLSEQFISRRSPSPLDSHRSDMTDQDKWSGSEVRSIQSSDCPRQEQKGHTVNKAQLTSVLPQCPFSFCEVNIKGEEKKTKKQPMCQLLPF